MPSNTIHQHKYHRLTLASMPMPAKALVTCIIVTLGIGMLGALGQIIVHDIIPTFYAKPKTSDEAGSNDRHEGMQMESTTMLSSGNRGDLFADLVVVKKKKTQPFYQHEQFVWTLKWTHIHLFGMSMIFIFLGAVTIWLDASTKLRTWLVVLPFAGVIVDIIAMWLKAFVSPTFFWLHVPGGGLFAIVFGYVSLRALWEMWLKP